MSDLQIDEAKIAETAYLFWLDEGQPEGRDQEHWLKAIDALTPAKPKKARKAPAKKAKAPAKKATAKAAPKKAVAKKPAAKKAKVSA